MQTKSTSCIIVQVQAYTLFIAVFPRAKPGLCKAKLFALLQRLSASERQFAPSPRFIRGLKERCRTTTQFMLSPRLQSFNQAQRLALERCTSKTLCPVVKGLY